MPGEPLAGRRNALPMRPPTSCTRRPLAGGTPGPCARAGRLSAALALAGAAAPAHASFLSGDALDTAANVIAWVALILVPVIAIVVFWIVHVMPEKIAHKRHHPQTQAIQTLCLLSLVFGGMLWPFAWLWAYTRPVMHRMAYGTDLHEEFFLEQGERARAGTLLRDDLAHLRRELDAMHERGALPPKLAKLREELDELAAQAGAEDAGAQARESGSA